MCYATEYSCNVYCLNADLDIPAALNNTIQGQYLAGLNDTRCHITSCVLTDRFDGMGMSTMHPVAGLDPIAAVVPFLPFIAIGLIVVCVLILRGSKEDPGE